MMGDTPWSEKQQVLVMDSYQWWTGWIAGDKNARGLYTILDMGPARNSPRNEREFCRLPKQEYKWTVSKALWHIFGIDFPEGYEEGAPAAD